MTTHHFTVERSTPLARTALGIGILLVITAATLPLWAGNDILITLVEFLYFLALAQMWNLLAGYGGLVSIGQQAYVGVGAYALVSMSLFFGVNPYVAVPLAGIFAGLVAWPAARILFRLSFQYC